MKWRSIVEARSNPDKNLRRHILTELEQYAGQKDVFLSFTAGFDMHVSTPIRSRGGQNKIGVNPRSRYDTPLGIYCYPVDYILEYSKQQGGFAAPFTGEAKWSYLYVIRRSTNNYADASTDTAPFFEKLHDLTVDILGEDQGENLVRDAIHGALRRADPQSQFWNLARLLAAKSLKFGVFGKKAPVAWNVIMRRIGLDMFVDDAGSGIIHNNEPTQAVFFTPQAFRVINCIQASNTKTDLNQSTKEQLFAQVKSRKLNIDSIDPLKLKRLFDQRGIEADDLVWVASKLEPVQKRIVNQSLTEWPFRLTFNSESLDALRGFGPIPIDMIITSGVKSNKSNLADWPEWFGRLPTNKEWVSIFERYNNYGQDPNVRLFEAKAPFITADFLINCYAVEGHAAFPNFGVIQHCAEQNGVPMEGKLLEEAFVNSPGHVVESHPDQKWTFAQWYRALRSNPMDEKLGELIPLNYAQPILMRDGNKKFMTRSLLNRFMAEKPEFVVMWMPQRGTEFWHQSYPELTSFIEKYLPAMAQRNPDMIRYVRLPHDYKPDARLLATIWRDWRNDTKYCMHTMQRALEKHWITQADFANHLDERLAPLATDWENYGWGYIDDDLFVNAMLLADELDRIKVDHLPALMRIAPDKMQYWEGRMTATDARELFIEYPECRTNYSVLHSLTAPYIYDFWQKGELPFANIFPHMQYRIINAALLHDDTTFQKLNAPNGPFSPQPLDPRLWRANVPADSLVQGGSDKTPCGHHLAMALFNAYNVDFAKLQLIVGVRTMHEVAKNHGSYLVYYKPFGNTVPDSILTPLQDEYISDGIKRYGAGMEGAKLNNLVHMLFAKVAAPTQEVRMKYAEYLQP